MQVIVERATQISKFSYEDSELISSAEYHLYVEEYPAQ